MESEMNRLASADGDSRSQDGSTSQRSFTHNDKPADNPSMLIEPRNINVHQFYPVLEHTFAKSASNFAKEQNNKMEVAIKNFVQDSDTGAGGSSTLAITAADVTGDAEGTEEGADVNNSARQDPQKPEPDIGMFSTAVDEDVLEAARQRGQGTGIFSTDDWQNEAPPSTPGLRHILIERTTEHINKSDELCEKGEFTKAVVCLSRAISLQPNNPLLYVKRAEAYMQLCDFQSSLLNYKKACILEPNNNAYFSRLAFLYYFQGQVLYDQHLYAEALESFSRAAEMKPENIGYHIRSISCLAALQRHGECLALTNKRIQIDTGNPDLYIMRARLHDMFRNSTLCFYDVKDALALDDKHREANLMLENLEKRSEDNRKQCLQLNVMGKYREALQKITVAIETNPAKGNYHVTRGALHRKLRDFNAAIDDFLLALDKCDHDEDNPVYTDSQRQLLLTYNDFAVECFMKNFFEEAIILLNKAIKGEKNEKGLYINRGDCFFKQNSLNFALQDYHQALELDDYDQTTRARIAIIHNEFGVIAYQDKNYILSEAKFNKAIQYNPHIGQYYISRARSRFMLENANGAKQDLMLGILLDPSNEDVISILSRLFPGKSVSDVVHSPAANAARHTLENLVATASPVRLKPLDRNEDETAIKLSPPAKVRSRLWAKQESIPNLAMCIEERDFNMQFAKDKKSVQTKVKDAMLNRRSLRYTGPRVCPLPPVTPPRSSSSKKQPRRTWKKFSLGIGL